MNKELRVQSRKWKQSRVLETFHLLLLSHFSASSTENLVFSSKTPNGSKVNGFHPAIQQEDGPILCLLSGALRQAGKSALER